MIPREEAEGRGWCGHERLGLKDTRKSRTVNNPKSNDTHFTQPLFRFFDAVVREDTAPEATIESTRQVMLQKKCERISILELVSLLLGVP
jgi:hypothetical protein